MGVSYDFKFGDLWLSEFGGFTSKMPQRDIAQYDYTLVPIPGKDGSDFIDNHRYKNVEFSREVVFNAQKNRRISNLPRRVIEWLGYQTGYREFEDTLHPGFVTKAVITNFPEVVSVLGKINTATLRFSRLPFWYRKDALEHQEIDLTAESVELQNPFLAPSEPEILFFFDSADTSPATISYTVTNGGVTKEYTISDIPVSSSRYLYVDCQAKEIRSGQGATLQYIEFPEPWVFDTGETVFAVTQGKSRLRELYIMPRWRCLEG